MAIDKYDVVEALNYFDPDENSNKMYLVFRDSKTNTGCTLYTRMSDDAPSIQHVIGLVQTGTTLPRSVKCNLEQGMTQSKFDRIVYNKTRVRTGKSTYSRVPLATKADVQSAQLQLGIGGAATVAHNALVPAAKAIHPSVMSFVDLVHRLANQSIQQHFTGNVAALSLSQIQVARDVVKRLKPIIDLVTDVTPQNDVFLTTYRPTQAEQSALKQGVTEYYRTIPTALGRKRKIDPVQLIEDFTILARKGEIEDRIQQLETALANISMPAAQQVTRYGGLDTKIVPCNPGDPEYDHMLKHIRATRPRQQINQMFLLMIPDERKRFIAEPLGKDNVHPMFHASNNANMLSILKNGIIIPTYASNGSRFGRGMYFADAFERSAGYTGRASSRDPYMMFMTMVGIGKPYKSSGSNSSYTSAPHGYDSVWGTGTWSGRGDEFIVYRLGQATIQAIVLFD